MEIGGVRMSILEDVNRTLNSYAHAKSEGLDLKGVASKIRDELKRIRGCQFIINIERVVYGTHEGIIKIYIVGAPFNVLRYQGKWGKEYEINHFHYDKVHQADLTPEGLDLVGQVVRIVESYRWDSSEPKADIFKTNFSYVLKIGNIKKPFERRG